MEVEVAVIGGGPAGLATAAELVRRGLSVAVFEAQEGELDKACGEGLMPVGVQLLRGLGVEVRRFRPFYGIRYELGSRWAEGRFREGPGWGIRRLELSRALREVLPEGVLHQGVRVLGFEQRGDRVHLDLRGGTVSCRYLVGADGLNSFVRRTLEGSGARPSTLRRWGIRRHFRLAPWSDKVTVMLGDRVESYITPVGDDQVGVAFLWEPTLLSTPGGRERLYQFLLARFPELQQRLAAAEPVSEIRAVGPLWRNCRSVQQGRVALVGDASGYTDALTGEGITLALQQAHDLAAALAAGRPSAYRRAHLWHRLPYEISTRLVLSLVRGRRLAPLAVTLLHRYPRLFSALLSLSMGRRPF